MKLFFNPLTAKPTYNVRAQRTFTVIRKYSFLFTLLVALAGQLEPKLGLLVIPVMIGLILASFFKGRYWCGNICAHGSLFDSFLFPLSRNGKIPRFLGWAIVSVMVLAWFGFRMGSGFVRASGFYGTPGFWDRMGMVFVNSYMMVVIAGSVLGLVVSPRTWCNFCPMGAMQKVSHFLGRKAKVTSSTEEKVTISNTRECHKCGKCARVCPMQLSPYDSFNSKNQLDNVNCLKCSTCVVHCPAGILTLANEKTADFIFRKVKKEAGKDRKRFETTVYKVTQLKEDVKEFIFQLTDDSIRFTPGQFILVRIEEKPEMFRAFSVSRFDINSRQIGVTVKKAPAGYGTDILFNSFSEGMTAVLEGPIGDELVIDKDSRKAVFVGGGIGITPFLPLVQDAIERDHIEEVKLIYGVNKEDEILYAREFEKLEKESSKFEFIRVVAFDENWKGEKGFVTNVMEKLDLKDNVIYMCGPPPMINASRAKLSDLGIDEERIRYESA